MSASTQEASAVTCCILPFVSVKRMSKNFTSLSLISFITSSAVLGLSGMETPSSVLELLS
jgi:hypothetical protein